MSKQPRYAPKHRAPSPVQKPTKALRNTLVISSVAVAVTGVTVGGGMLGAQQSVTTVSGGLTDSGGRPAASPGSVAALGGSSAQGDGLSFSTGDPSARTSASGDDTDPAEASEESADSPDSADSAAGLAVRTEREASRDDRRQPLDPVKKDALEAQTGDAVTVTDTLSDDDPRDVAKALLGDFGFGQDQFGCLDSLWTKESNWNVYADNPSSSAYGIPQALPGSKMSAAGADWADNPATQISWGLGYIRDRYGSPCSAWGHSQSYNWY